MVICGHTDLSESCSSRRPRLVTPRDGLRFKSFIIRLILAVVGIMPLVIVTACAGDDSSGADSQDSIPDSLTLATGFAIDNVDPLKNGYWANEFGWGELLMRPVSGKKPKPWLLKSLESDNVSTWKLTLRKGIHFQNGNPLDASALADVLRYQLEKKPSLKRLKDTRVKVSGKREVTLDTHRSIPDMPSILADESMFVIYDQKAYSRTEKSPQDLIDAKMYTGPYVVESLSDQKMAMQADTDYWNGRPPLDKVTVKFIAEEDSRILAVQKGEADLALYPPTKSAKSLKGRKDSYRVEGSPEGPTFQYHLNQHHTPLNKTPVRKALLDGIDYRELAEDVMDGRYKVADGMYAPNASYAIKTQKTDREKSRQELRKAGFKRDSDGRWSKGGKPLTLKVLTYPEQPDSKALAVAIQSQYKKLGIGMKIQQVSDIDEKLADPKGDWDLGIIGNSTTSAGGDPTKFLQNYMSRKGARNGSGVADPVLDKLIHRVSTGMDEQQRDKRLAKIQRVVHKKGYMGFLGRRVPAVVAGPEWRGYRVPAANLWVDASTTAA